MVDNGFNNRAYIAGQRNPSQVKNISLQYLLHESEYYDAVLQ